MPLPPDNERETDERLTASAAEFLIQGGEEDAASMLLSCLLEFEIRSTYKYLADFDEYINTGYHDIWIYLKCPRSVYDILTDSDNPLSQSIQRSIKAILPPNILLKDVVISGELVDIDPSWCTELLEIARGKRTHNQLADQAQAKVRTWKDLRFRSVSEVRIAMALDAAGVFFLPNCRGRLNTPLGRENREADFLVCNEGKWGILEVDGEPFHPPSRTVHDHERDRLFKSHGILVVEHFDASECFENAGAVVAKFLAILRQS